MAVTEGFEDQGYLEGGAGDLCGVSTGDMSGDAFKLRSLNLK